MLSIGTVGCRADIRVWMVETSGLIGSRELCFIYAYDGAETEGFASGQASEEGYVRMDGLDGMIPFL